jgi:hypothetical protein
MDTTKKLLLSIQETMALWAAGHTTHESTLLSIQAILKGVPKLQVVAGGAKHRKAHKALRKIMKKLHKGPR